MLNIITFTTNISFSQRDGQVWEYHFEEGAGSLRRMTFCSKQHIFIYQKITLYQSLKRLEIFTSIIYSTFSIYNSFKIVFIHVYIYLNIKRFKQYFLTSVYSINLLFTNIINFLVIFSIFIRKDFISFAVKNNAGKREGKKIQSKTSTLCYTI